MVYPFRINLEQQKKRAKELLKAFKSGDPLAIQRFLLHPKVKFEGVNQEKTEFRLSDAQLVIARELNCSSWAALKSHCFFMQQAFEDVESAKLINNENKDWVHIRCGSDLKRALEIAGFSGRFIEFSDPLCMGPVSYEYNPDQRSRFLHKAFGRELGKSKAKLLNEVNSAFKDLKSAIESESNIALWFEHDSYDQFILCFILSELLNANKTEKVFLISINQFPGSEKFVGLGQLPPEAFRLLWSTKKELTLEQLRAGDHYWQSYTTDPLESFKSLVEHIHHSPLPYFQMAARRHLADYLVPKDEIPLTQKFIIEIISSGPLSAGKIFGTLIREKEPLPWLGDIMYWYLMENWLAQEKPLFFIKEDHEDWPQKIISLTEDGEVFFQNF